MKTILVAGSRRLGKSTEIRSILSDAEVLVEARKFSPGIAEWIDAQVLKGAKPAAIVRILKASVEFARATRGKPGIAALTASRRGRV